MLLTYLVWTQIHFSPVLNIFIYKFESWFICKLLPLHHSYYYSSITDYVTFFFNHKDILSFKHMVEKRDGVQFLYNP